MKDDRKGKKKKKKCERKNYNFHTCLRREEAGLAIFPNNNSKKKIQDVKTVKTGSRS